MTATVNLGVVGLGFMGSRWVRALAEQPGVFPLYYEVHGLDLVRWYGGEVGRMFAERSWGVLQESGYDVEDLYSATFRCSGGVHGTAMVGWSLPDLVLGFGIGGITVIGADGTLRVVQGETGFLQVDGHGVTHADVHFAPEVHGATAGRAGDRGQPFRGQRQGRSRAGVHGGGRGPRRCGSVWPWKVRAIRHAGLARRLGGLLVRIGGVTWSS